MIDVCWFLKSYLIPIFQTSLNLNNIYFLQNLWYFTKKNFTIGIIWTNIVPNNYFFYHTVQEVLSNYLYIFWENWHIRQNFSDDIHFIAYRMRRGWGRRSSAGRGASEWSYLVWNVTWLYKYLLKRVGGYWIYAWRLVLLWLSCSH